MDDGRQGFLSSIGNSLWQGAKTAINPIGALANTSIGQTVGNFIAPRATAVAKGSYNAPDMVTSLAKYKIAEAKGDKKGMGDAAKSWQTATKPLQDMGMNSLDDVTSGYIPKYSEEAGVGDLMDRFGRGMTGAGSEMAQFMAPAIGSFGSKVGLLKKSGAGAAMGVAQALGEGKGLVDTAKQGIASGLLMPLGEGAFRGAGKGVKKLGEAVGSYGENIGLRSLGLAPTSDIYKINKKIKGFGVGTDISSFLKDHGILGDDLASMQAKHNELQDSFSKIAKDNNIFASGDDLKKGFENKIKEFSSSTFGATKAKGEEIKNAAEEIVKKVTGDPNATLDSLKGNIGIGGLTEIRKEADKLVNNFAKTGTDAETHKVIRDVLTEAIQSAADKAGAKFGDMGLKDMGRNLSIFKDLTEAAEKRAGKGQGSLPLGISKSAMSGTGATIGAGMGSTFGPAGTMVGGLLGSGAGMLAEGKINSPETMRAISKGAQNIAPSIINAGQKIMESNIPTVAGRLAGGAAADMMAGGTPQQEPQAPIQGLQAGMNKPDVMGAQTGASSGPRYIVKLPDGSTKTMSTEELRNEGLDIGSEPLSAGMTLNKKSTAEQSGGEDEIKKLAFARASAMRAGDTGAYKYFSGLLQDEYENQKMLEDIASKRQARELAKAKATGTAGGQNKQNEVGDTINLIDEIMGNPETGQKGRDVSLMSRKVMSNIPGTEAYGTAKKIDEVKSKLALAARGQLKGQGTVSDSETKMLKEAVSALDTGMSEKDFADEMKKIKGVLNRSLQTVPQEPVVE